MLYILCFFAAFCSYSYEFLLAKALSNLTDSIVLWQSVTIGFFILANGLGVFYYTFYLQSSQFKKIITIEFFLTIFGLLSIPFIYSLHIFYRIYARDYGVVQPFESIRFLHLFALVAQIMPIIIGFLSGIELSYFLEKADSSFYKNKSILVLFVYHVGALFSSCVFSYFFIQELEHISIAIILSSCNLFLAFLIIVHFKAINLKNIINFSFCLYLIYFSLIHSEDFFQIHAKNFYYNHLSWHHSSRSGVITKKPRGIFELPAYLSLLPKIKRVKSLYQEVDFVNMIGKVSNNQINIVKPFPDFVFYLNRHYQFDSINERNYHEHMAHLPSSFLKRDRLSKVLVLGGGDGLLLRELLKYKKINSLTLVEIDPKIIFLAKHEPLLTLNEGALLNNKVNIEFGDAFNWVRRSTDKFDEIYIDFPFPYNLDGLRLYSLEFFQMVINKLTKNGYLVIDIPFQFESIASYNLNSSVVSLFFQSGFKKVLAFRSEYDSFILASKDSWKDKIINSLKIFETVISFDADYFKNPDNFRLYSKPSRVITSANSIFKPKKLIYYDYSF